MKPRFICSFIFRFQCGSIITIFALPAKNWMFIFRFQCGSIITKTIVVDDAQYITLDSNVVLLLPAIMKQKLKSWNLQIPMWFYYYRCLMIFIYKKQTLQIPMWFYYYQQTLSISLSRPSLDSNVVLLLLYRGCGAVCR